MALFGGVSCRHLFVSEEVCLFEGSIGGEGGSQTADHLNTQLCSDSRLSAENENKPYSGPSKSLTAKASPLNTLTQKDCSVLKQF